MIDVSVGTDTIAMIAGVIISLLFSYIPKLNTAFAALLPEVKRLIMLGIMLVVAVGLYVGSCYGIFNAVTCDKAGILQLVTYFVYAVIGNQGTYSITPQTPSVKEVARISSHNI